MNRTVLGLVFFSVALAAEALPQRVANDDSIILKPEATSSTRQIVSLINEHRSSASKRLVLDLGAGLLLNIPDLPKQNLRVKPNPLTLVVTIGPSGKIALNNQPHGSLSDLSVLSNKLREVFKAREESGVQREDSTEIDTTVFIKPRLDTNLATLVAVATVVKDAGSTIVVLQVDDLPE